MASIPRVPSNGVSPAAYPNVRVSPDAPIQAFWGGNGTFQEAGALAGDVGQRAYQDAQKRNAYQEKLKDEARQIASAEYAAKFSAEETRLKTQLSGVRGKDAMKASQDTLGEFDKFYEAQSKGVSDPDLKARVRGHFLQYKNSLNSFAQPYAASQLTAYDNEVNDSLVQNETTAAVDSWNDPERVNLAVARVFGSIEALGARNGHSEEWMKAEERQSLGRLYTGVINRMIAAGDVKKATDYFKAHENDFLDPDRIKENLQEGSRRGTSQDIVRSVFQEYDPRDGPPENEADAVGRASAILILRKLDDPKLKDEVMTRVRNEWAMQDRVRRQVYADKANEAARIVENGDNPPPDLWNSLKGVDQKTLKLRQQQIVKGQRPEGFNKWYELKIEAANPETRKRFLDRNLALLRSEMSDERIKDLTEDQVSLLKADGKAEKVLTGFLSKDQIVGQMAEGAGLKKKTDPYNQFLQSVDREVEAEKEQKKSDISNKRVSEIASELLTTIKVVQPGRDILGIPFTDWLRSDVVSDKKLWEYKFSDITPEEHKQIVDALNTLKIPVNERSMMMLYREGLKKKWGAPK